MKLAEKRIRHLEKYVNSQATISMNELAIDNLVVGRGSRGGSLDSLESYSRAMAMCSWFVESDIDSCRDWFYTSAILQAERSSQIGAEHRHEVFSFIDASSAAFSNSRIARYQASNLLQSLYSGFNDRWELNFIARQIGLIFLGELDNAERSAQDARRRLVLKSGPLSTDVQVFFDMFFGEKERLVVGIEELCRRSNETVELESGFTEGLMSTPATLYAKLCHLVGREVEIANSLVPAAWLGGDDFERTFKFPGLEEALSLLKT